MHKHITPCILIVFPEGTDPVAMPKRGTREDSQWRKRLRLMGTEWTTTNIDHQPALYSYRSLVQSTKEIRILILEPAEDESADLRFSFDKAELTNLGSIYEAICYVWGQPVLDHALHHTVESSQLSVTRNLDEAPRKLRRRSEPRRLWADAVCIDQSNDREKEAQIAILVEIFQNAEKVIAWLGQGSTLIERGMSLIMLSSRKIGHNNQDIFDLATDRTGKSDSNAVLSVFRLPYFERLWIVQEIAFSLEIVFMYGNLEISWLRLLAVLAHIQHSPHMRQVQKQSGDNLNPIKAMARIWQENCLPLDSSKKVPNTDLLDLVSTFDSHHSTDARDRIFALHSMAIDRKLNPIDYTIDVERTYRNFALRYVKIKAIDIFEEARRRRGSNAENTWPSWIPDWRLTPTNFNKMDNRRKASLPQVTLKPHLLVTNIQHPVAFSFDYYNHPLKLPL